MSTTFTRPCSLLAAALAATLWAWPTGGVAAPPRADRIEAQPMGTVTTYHRKSSGSLGSYDGPVVWTHSSGTWQGKPAVSFGSPVGGAALHDPVSFAILAQLDPAGKLLVSYDPPMDYAWPLEVGKTWSTNYTVTNHVAGRVVQVKVDGKVESWGDITVPAGTFKAFKLVWSNSLGESETRWVAPQDGLATVKRHVERVASHPQGPGVLDAELLSRQLPAP